MPRAAPVTRAVSPSRRGMPASRMKDVFLCAVIPRRLSPLLSSAGLERFVDGQVAGVSPVVDLAGLDGRAHGAARLVRVRARRELAGLEMIEELHEVCVQ